VKIVYNIAQTFEGIFLMTFPLLPLKQMILYRGYAFSQKFEACMIMLSFLPVGETTG